MASDRQHRLAIVQYGRLLHENGFVAATDGNLSVRIDERKLLVAEIVQPAFVFQKGILQLPGMRWLSRRLNHSIPSTDATKA